MGISMPNQLLIHHFKNLILILSFFFLQLTPSVAQDGRDSIQLPPIQNDADKFAVLLQIKEKVPNLFSDAAEYDIDLFGLLEDEEKLLDHLKSNPEYLELFQHKKYHEIQISPPREGLQVGEVSIDPLAIQEWKEQLKNNLNHFKLQQEAGHENTNPLEVLYREITAKVQSITEANSSLDGNGLLKDLGKIKANQAILNPALKESGAKTLSGRLSTALKIYDQLPEKPSHVSPEKLRKALEIEQNQEDLKSLIELYSTLNRRGQSEEPAHHTWQTAEFSLNELHSENLTTFQDKEDYLRPMIHQLIPSSPLSLQEDMLNRIHKTISSFANRTISSEKKAIDPVTISQQHPIVGIFRGCVGGDCSSKYSFPYPNDPNEKVFFILDKNKKVKGYVSATDVNSHGKPSLYVITVSGNRVTSADTELILRGLEKEKAKLGVEQILLPTQDKIRRLMNFPAPQSVYEKYTTNQPNVKIQYKNPDMRSVIQNYESNYGYNHGVYDYMSQNTEAVVFNLKSNSAIHSITTQTLELPIIPLKTPSFSSIPKSEVFEFLMDLKRSHREELEKKILQIHEVQKLINPEIYQQLTQFLSEDQFAKSMTVQQFKNSIIQQLSDLDRTLGDYLERKPNLIYPAVLSCTDAFSPENIDEIAQQFVNYITSTNEEFTSDDPVWMTKIEEHLTELNRTNTFKTFKEKMVNNLQDHSLDSRKNALSLLTKIKLNDSSIHSAILQIALHNSNAHLKIKALDALRSLKPRDLSIQAGILEVALNHPNPRVRWKALSALGEINPTHSEIQSGILRVANRHFDHLTHAGALQALSKIKPTDPNIQLGILNLSLHKSTTLTRYDALNTLFEIKPSNPEVLREVFQITVKNTDPESRALAIQILENTDLSNSSVRQALSEELLKHAQELNNRQDLSSLKNKIMTPHVFEKKRKEKTCQMRQAFMNLQNNLKALFEFFSTHVNPSVNPTLHQQEREVSDRDIDPLDLFDTEAAFYP